MSKKQENIFSNITVLDLTKVFSGPFGTRILADYGAEVIKIENPEAPDDTREYPPVKNKWSGYFEILNRNKKGISLNLKNPKDLKKFYTLAKKADVIAENLTPKVKKRLKIDYPIIKKLNPKIIYASLTGLGQKYNTKYYDILAQAESGLISLTGTPDMPTKVGPAIIDAFSGSFLALSISSALFHRERTGKGQYIDISMLDCAMNMLESNLIAYSISKKNPVRTGNKDNLISPFGLYKCKNGYIALACGNNKQWQTLSDLLEDYSKSFPAKMFTNNTKRLKNNATLTKYIEKYFKKFTKKLLLEKLAKLDIPSAPVNEMNDVARDQKILNSGAIKKVRHNRLGEIIIPGRCMNFSAVKNKKYEAAPKVGRDNKKFGLRNK